MIGTVCTYMYVTDPNYERAVKLRKKMIANIEMAKDRVKKLCQFNITLSHTCIVALVR